MCSCGKRAELAIDPETLLPSPSAPTLRTYVICGNLGTPAVTTLSIILKDPEVKGETVLGPLRQGKDTTRPHMRHLPELSTTCLA